MSCVGRERMFEYFSNSKGTAVSIIRLNYAVEMRYGVMVDIAQKAWRGEAVPLAMGYFNAIWQGDANAMALESLGHASSPAFVLNVAGPETLSVCAVCEQFGRLMNKPAKFSGEESPNALLSNGQKSYRLFGDPPVPAERMHPVDRRLGDAAAETINKPTHFEERKGSF